MTVRGAAQEAAQVAAEGTLESARRLLAVEPALAEIAPLRALASTAPEATLLHAGPPYRSLDEVPAPVLNAAAASAEAEGWAASPQEFRGALAAGRIRLAPAQDHGVVTPLAFVVGPSTPCLKAVDLARPDRFKLCPLNDGAPPHALRFGTASPEGLAALRRLTDAAAAEVATGLTSPIPLLPVLAAGLAGGDDLHGRVAAAQAALLARFARPLGPAAEAYLAEAGQFALNAIMAAAALMLSAGEGREGSAMAVGAGGNGARFGWRRADAPGVWITAPALQPVGVTFPGREAERALPAIGDSAVIDALGFGAAALRFSPELLAALAPAFEAGEIAETCKSEAAHAPYLAEHPALGQPGLRLGLDLDAPQRPPGIMLGMVEASGRHGLIGRGVAPWPMAR